MTKKKVPEPESKIQKESDIKQIRSVGSFDERKKQHDLDHARRLNRILHLWIIRTRHPAARGKRPVALEDKIGLTILKAFEEQVPGIVEDWPDLPKVKVPKDSVGNARRRVKIDAIKDEKKRRRAQARGKRLEAAEVHEAEEAAKPPKDSLKLKGEAEEGDPETEE